MEGLLWDCILHTNDWIFGAITASRVKWELHARNFDVCGEKKRKARLQRPENPLKGLQSSHTCFQWGRKCDWCSRLKVVTVLSALSHHAPSGETWKKKKKGCTLCQGRRRIFQDSCFIKGSSGLWWWRYQSPVTQTMRSIFPAAVTTRRLVKQFQKWHHLLWDFFITFPLRSSSKREKYSKS